MGVVKGGFGLHFSRSYAVGRIQGQGPCQGERSDDMSPQHALLFQCGRMCFCYSFEYGLALVADYLSCAIILRTLRTSEAGERLDRKGMTTQCRTTAGSQQHFLYKVEMRRTRRLSGTFWDHQYNPLLQMSRVVLHVACRSVYLDINTKAKPDSMRIKFRAAGACERDRRKSPSNFLLSVTSGRERRLYGY